MRLQMNPLVGIQTPPDGFTDEEREISRLAAEHTIQSVYGKLPTARMKAIVALHFELGYNQELVADMLNVTQSQISREIDLVRKVLTGKPSRSKHGRAYTPRRPKQTIRVHDLLELCHLLVQG